MANPPLMPEHSPTSSGRCFAAARAATAVAATTSGTIGGLYHEAPASWAPGGPGTALRSEPRPEPDPPHPDALAEAGPREPCQHPARVPRDEGAERHPGDRAARSPAGRLRHDRTQPYQPAPARGWPGRSSGPPHGPSVPQGGGSGVMGGGGGMMRRLRLRRPPVTTTRIMPTTNPPTWAPQATPPPPICWEAPVNNCRTNQSPSTSTAGSGTTTKNARVSTLARGNRTR